MNFAAIDFETANAERDSVCSMGIAIVEGGEIVKTAAWLIRPPKLYFNPINTMIHGITADDVRDKPEFNHLWEEILSYISGKMIIAHNASFDISVLRYVLDRYKLEYPELSYCCSVNIAKKTWTGLESYKLNALGEYLGFEFRHHDALEDAVAAARIVIEACKLKEVDDIEELSKKCCISCGKIYPGGYYPASSSTKNKKNKYGISAGDIIPANINFDTDSPCYRKVFTFTGTLSSMQRKAAMQKVVDNGGICSDMVYEGIDYLVAGQQEPSRLKDGKKSVKQKTAEMLIEKGCNIRIISEEDFLKML
ncbi:MAG: exonuclease domain-containing protein [Bacillota bacterium]